MAKQNRGHLPSNSHGFLRPVVSDPLQPQLTACEILNLRQPTNILVVSVADGKVYIPEVTGNDKKLVCVQDIVARLRDERARSNGKQVTIPGSIPLPEIQLDPPTPPADENGQNV